MRTTHDGIHARAIVGICALALTLLAACTGGSGDGTPTPVSPSGPRPSSTAKLAIVSPKDGAVVRGPNVPVRVSLKDARIVQPTSTHLVPNEGHLHVILDQTLVSMTAGTRTVLPNVAPGHHLLQVEFVANDHAPFDPRVLAAVTFEVKG